MRKSPEEIADRLIYAFIAAPSASAQNLRAGIVEAIRVERAEIERLTAELAAAKGEMEYRRDSKWQEFTDMEAALAAAGEENARLREAMQDLARQRLTAEMDDDEISNADFEGAHDTMVDCRPLRLIPQGGDVMKAIQAFEGVGGNLHRHEADALAEIIFDAGQGTVSALLSTTDPSYQKRVRAALLRAAEILGRVPRP